MLDDRKRKPSQLYDALSLSDDDGDRAAAARRPSLNRRTARPYSARYYELMEMRRTLPVWEHKDDFMKLLHHNKVVIIVGNGGTGKTTQVPQFALQWVSTTGLVACTQPWKVAAMSASRRVAEEMDVEIGDEVGYSVPFEDCSSEKTILKYLTDVMLLREAACDPLLRKYQIIVLDEAHERTLATSMLFVILKDAIAKRPDLRVIILGAPDTTEENKLKCFFDNAPPIVRLLGSQLQSVPIHYIPETVTAYVDLAISTTVQVHRDRAAGHILVFLPREQQVDYACHKISQELYNSKDEAAPYIIIPLYSDLPLEMQRVMFEPAPIIWKVGGPPMRKIFVSTKIAETSITLDGLVYIIDTGLSNRVVDNIETGVQTLNVSWISKASANRRANLARRVQHGVCFRLYTEEIFEKELSRDTYAESLALDLPGTLLTMKKFGISDHSSLGYPNALEAQTITKAMGDLCCLGAVNLGGYLTSLGETMTSFPLDPQMSAMLIASSKYKCSNEIISIAAMMLVPDCFMWPADAEKAADIWKKFWHIDGDHLALLRVYDAYIENNRDSQWCGINFISAPVMNQAYLVRQQLAKIMTGLNLRLCSPDPNSDWFCNNIKLAMLSGYFLQVVHWEKPNRAQPGAYVTLRDRDLRLQIDETTFLTRRPEFVMYSELNTGTMRSVTDVSAAMLLHVARDYYNLRSIPRCGTKVALERVLLNWLTTSNPRYDYLYDLDRTELQLALERLQWETVVPVRQAPEAPAADEQGAGSLPPE